jgi:hypothetical protein
MTITIDNLRPKFLPYLIGTENCKANQETQNEIKTFFEKGANNFENSNDQNKPRSYIQILGPWIVKEKREDGILTTPDTHLYRIRKAEKIQRYITKHHLESLFAVPQKWLYHDTNKVVVLAKKLDLSNEVASFASDEIKQAFLKLQDAKDQNKALQEGCPEKDISPE